MKNIKYILLALALTFSLINAAWAQQVFRDNQLVMGYLSPSQVVDVVGYDRCFTSIGDYLWIRSDNSQNKEPRFEVTVTNSQVRIAKNQHADGRGAYVCHNTELVNRKILSGYVPSGTNIGAGLSCVLSISNFSKVREGGGTVPGSVSCAYNSATGRVQASATQAGRISNCGYVCVDPSVEGFSNVISRSYKILSGSENIGTNRKCALGTNFFFSECSGAGVAAASYDSSTGLAIKGINGGCSDASFSYFCSNSTQCQDGIDNDADGFIDGADFSCGSPGDNDETNPKAQCQDGLDNDVDGLTDLTDPGCSNNQDNNEGDGTSQCQDTLDNDSDGAIDFPIDFSCTSRQDNDETNIKAQCQDGLDNDSDGLIDLVDPGCSNAQDNNEADGTSQCQDTLDNDSDGAIDFPNDFSCTSRQDNDETNTKAQCQDGLDNDSDGLIDLVDPGCSNAQDNNEGDGTSQCQDTLDNDSDGAIDFPNDFSCTSRQDNDETNIKAQCQDTLDNDSDGAIDFPNDFSCTSRQDNDETNIKAQCQDTLDNDSDGAIDFPNDFSCTSRQDNDETNTKAQCQDGLDNDSDGLIDLVDPGCSNAQDNNEGDGTSQCQDTLDNDSDGLIDLVDPGCSNAQDNNEGDGTSQCQDTLDNDSDGAIDFPNDFSCTSRQDNDETNTKAQCQDGLDNDSDGLIDLVDPGCSNAQDNNEGDGTSQCQDTLDNDSDGLIDLVDPGCSNAQDNNEGDGTSQCQDTLDNDSDGAVDFPNDFSCTSRQDNDETNIKAQCQDALDNDSDGAIDFPNDFSCTSEQDNDEANIKSQCQDGVDNDSDGAIDLLDPGCAGAQDNNEADEVLKLAVGVDCVLDNFDGTKTAFFSYNNSTAQTINIAVGSTTSPATKNEFSPGAPDRGQPTSFAPGIVKGAVGVPLSGGTVTWSVRSQGGSVSTATASAASPACATVQPLAECQGFDNGVLRVLGGYQNLNNFEVKIPIGALNNFSPGNQDQGQPEKFLSGMNKGAFNINLTDTSTVLTWTLNGLQAVASTALPICSGECVDTPVGSITEEIDQLAVQIADITKQAAAILSSAEATVAKTSKVSSKKRTRTQARIAASADRVDAERATAKANGYVTQSQELTIQIPDVVKNCPEAPQFCQTVDNGPTIDALRNLFAQARNTAQRTIARAYFRNTGATNRKDSLVAQAKSLESQGLAQLDQIPRTSTECQ